MQYEIKIKQETPNYIFFSIWSSPKINEINFIKGNKNKSTLREYATAEIYLNNKIDKHIIEYFKEKGTDKIAYLSYIRIIKKKHNNFFTVLNNSNTIKTIKRNKYRNKQKNNTIKGNRYILSKGYGKILLQYIEHFLKEKGIQYLVLIPSVKPLIEYYTNAGYTIEYIPNNSIDKENNNYILKYNNQAVSQYMIMYKKLK